MHGRKQVCVGPDLTLLACVAAAAAGVDDGPVTGVRRDCVPKWSHLSPNP